MTDIGRWVVIKREDVINDTLDGVSIHPVTTKIQTSFLTPLPERKETAQEIHHEAFKMVTLNQLQSLMAVLGEK
jgi:hypothetical protein